MRNCTLISARKIGLGFGLAALLFAAPVHAGVNVNNGNFYIAYTDFFVATPGINIDITRTYNSRSSYVKSYFGVGHSSELESFVEAKNGNVVYYEGGGGNVIKFEPVKGEAGVYSNGVFGVQKIRTAKTGYVLETATGKVMSFGDKGQLVRVSDRNKNFLELVYDQGQLATIRDNFNNQVKVKWATFGKYPRIVLLEMGDKKARYEYGQYGDLVKAWGADGVPYEYAYDDEHNMTRISYKDGSFKEMAYNKSKDWVTKYRDVDGMVTRYDYFADNLDPENKFGTTVSRQKEGSQNKDISKFWYEFRRRADGSRYNHKAVTLIRGTVTETIFTECCGTPLVISQWRGDDAAPASSASALAWIAPKPEKRSTFFEYYPDGLLKKKTAFDGTVTALTYDPKHRKVASVDKGGRKIQYNYDVRGNLAWALDGQGKRRLDLTYDEKGRITIVKEALLTNVKQGRTVFFRYDAAGKPVEIKEKTFAGKEGLIKLTYGADGEVSGVFNAQGRAVASADEIASAQRIAATFQGLLEIVQPAGVTLTPES